MRDVKELLSVSQGSDAVEMWPNVPILHGGRAVTNNTSSSMRNKKGCGGDRVSHDCLARFLHAAFAQSTQSAFCSEVHRTFT